MIDLNDTNFAVVKLKTDFQVATWKIIPLLMGNHVFNAKTDKTSWLILFIQTVEN